LPQICSILDSAAAARHQGEDGGTTNVIDGRHTDLR
jgi:hypothetical protein